MNYVELQDAVIRNRFNAGDRDDVKIWLNMNYVRVWNAADWDWREVGPTAITLVTSGPTPVPDDFGRERQMFDDTGDNVPYLPPGEFDLVNEGIGGSVSRPELYTRRNRGFEFSPTPDAAYGFSVSYRRRLSHINGSDQIVQGGLTDDEDRPIWDEDDSYDGYLIAAAKATGAALNGDPTSAFAKEEAAGLFSALMNERAAPGGLVQYGRDTL